MVRGADGAYRVVALMAAAMMTATGVRVIPDQPDRCDRCDACGKYRPFQSGLCWQCKDAIAKYEAEFLRLGAAPAAIGHADSEFDAVVDALRWAAPGDTSAKSM